MREETAGQSEDDAAEQNEIVPLRPEMTLVTGVEVPADLPEVLKGLTLRMRTPAGAEVEIPLSTVTINVPAGAHPAPAGARTPPRYARCGNCGDRLTLTQDPIENHHIGMRHKFVCRAGSPGAGAAYRQLVSEFESQPNIVAQRENFERGERTRQLAAAQTPRLAAAEARKQRSWWKPWTW